MAVFTDETADDRKAKKELKKELDFAADERRRAVNSLYETPEGRTYLWFLLEHAGFLAFLSSNQFLTDLIRINPEAFADLIKERFTDARTRAVPRDDRGNDAGNDDGGDDADSVGEGVDYSDLNDPTLRYD